MAIQRLLYSTQSVFITVGGHLRDSGGTWAYRLNNSASVKGQKNAKDAGPVWTAGFEDVATFIVPAQSASVDETIPQDDVLVLGNLGGVKRLQKDVATSKCNLKCYLTEHMNWMDGATARAEGRYQTNNVQNDSAMSATALYDPSTTNYDEIPSTSGVDAPAGIDPTVLQPNLPGDKGPLPAITSKGRLAGENWCQNTKDHMWTKGGMLEQLLFEAQGGYESKVEMYHAGWVGSSPTSSESEQDGFTFFGILSSIGIDASKGAYPTLDLSWEGVGRVNTMVMGPQQGDGYYQTGTGSTVKNHESIIVGDNGGSFYITACHPHTSDDVLVWGREQTYEQTVFTSSGQSAMYTSGTSKAAEDRLILIASNGNNYYQGAGGGDSSSTDQTGQPLNNMTGQTTGTFTESNPGTQGNTDTINSAKFSLDMPTETLSALGSVIEGNSFAVRSGNATFSKPPFKASMTLDGQGLVMAGHERVINGEVIERILPNEIQIGELHCVLGVDSTSTSSRSFSQAVGDVGASYNISVEGTDASFYGTAQKGTASTATNVNNDWDTNRDVAASF